MQGKNHPELTDIKHICDITPEAKTSKDVCDKILKQKKLVKDNKLKK